MPGVGFVLAAATLFGSMVAPAAPALAPTSTATMLVTANIVANCTISITPMSFGNYSGVVLNTTATVSIRCTQGTAYDIELDAGTSSSTSVSQRLVYNSIGNAIGYNLYTDAAHSQKWGFTVGSDTVTGTGNGSLQAVTVYGEISAGQYSTPGLFADTVTATVTY